MEKAVKVILKVLLAFVCIIVIGVGIILGLRAYNDKKYGGTESLTDSDVTDISRYPEELDV